ncbi:unnamed protein product [Caenorhabditis auriculariae]|uniref:UDP-glucuronosyltransferase n=1 Tax=Caenorhabditis auriculariae TaxID=2777116 RepID=A0A8S1GV09_9PELO|nr:unnamed protein product [Caenorhabditis auriculariae]
MFEEAVWVESKNKDFILRVVTTVPAIGAFQCKDLFERKELLESLQNEKFDLAIAQPMQLCPYIFFDQLGISTVISASSTITMEPIRSSLGEPDDYNYVPATMAKMAEVSSWTETILNYLHNTAGGWYFEYSFSEEVDAVKDLVPDLKSWRDYMGNVAFAFVNSNPYLDYPRPYLPKSVPVGGMQVETEKIGLSKEWDEILSKRKTNVLISFGSNAHSSKMPDEFKKGFREVFTSMPETTFIWKYEEPNPTLVGDLPNVHLTVWMPQNALLADPRLNLFVTHGGLGSSMELAYIGVPAVVIPLMADQFRNGHMLARHGGAKILNKQDLAHGDVIRAAVKEILETPSYKKNAEKLAQVLRDQPLSPKESVLKHCNFAVK